MIDLEKLTESVKDVALDAGRFLRDQRKCFLKNLVVEKKTHDYVSYVDKESERRIVERLSMILPQAGFIAEEGHGSFSDEDLCWLVDPLDGTTNFIHDNAPYCVSIALRNREELLIGVVYEVCRDELFWAYKGGRAYCNGTPIQVSDVAEYDKSFIIIGLPYNSSVKEEVICLFDQLYGKVGGIRTIGACAAELCYLAMGRFEARVERHLGPWDIAAGVVILTCAGGKVSDFSGGNDFYSGKEVLASNGKMHDFMLKSIKNSADKKNNL